MPAAIIDPEIFADALVGIVDEIRGTVRAALGTRPYTVSIVRREWSGGRVGIGTGTTVELQLEPTPMFDESDDAKRGVAGAEPTGTAVLTEVSLTYTEAELIGDAGGAVEVCYVVRDIGGQGQAGKWFVQKGSPNRRIGDRDGDRSDWRIDLVATSPMTPNDGVDA